VIILGAGLAGLSAAYHLPGSTVFEQGNRVGGHAKSVAGQGFVFDEGIHVLHTSNQYVLDLLSGPAGVRLEEQRREAWIYHYGVFTRYPFQANTYGLPVDVVKECLLGFIENDHDQQKIETYEDWLYYQYGRGICERFMIPYSIKFWGVPPRELTTEWVSVRHPRPSLEEVLTGALTDQTKGFGVNAHFRYPREGGFGALAEGLADAVGRERIHLGHRVTRLDLDRRELEFNGRGPALPYETVVSTVPLPELVKLIPGAPGPVRRAANLLRTNSILVVNLGINRPQLTDKHWIYYPEADYSFFRVSFPMNFKASTAPVGASSIACEIAYGEGWEVDRAGIIDRVVADLRRSNILSTEDEVIFQEVIDIKYAYVLFDRNRRPAVRLIHEFLRAHGIFPCGRYGDWAYLWSDEAILSGRRAARAVRQGVALRARRAGAAGGWDERKVSEPEGAP
jgi:protoporphyrinogen oxidase